jgi:hypothetical protein
MVFIKYLSINIDNVYLCRWLIINSLKDNLRNIILNPDLKVQKLINDIEHMESGDKEAVQHCASNFILALAYFDPLFGSILKRGLFFSAELNADHVIRVLATRIPGKTLETSDTKPEPLESDLPKSKFNPDATRLPEAA